MKIPILFIIFNRLDTAKKVFEAIRNYRPSHLFVAADGARSEKQGEAAVCEEVRSWVLQHIDWDCEIKTLFQEKNLGCGEAPAKAITWFFEQVEEGIVLEDDCLPHPDFFLFCEKLLPYYRTNNAISIISGCNFDKANEYSTDDSYFYSVFPYTWGWASWRRNWQNYDYNLTEWKSIKSKKFLRRLFSEKKYQQPWVETFNSLSHTGKKDIWDFQFFFQCFKRKQLSIVPNVNLISNIGCNENGTHTLNADNPKANIPLQSMPFPLKHPQRFERNYGYDEALQKMNYGEVEQVSLFKMVKRFVKRIIHHR